MSNAGAKNKKQKPKNKTPQSFHQDQDFKVSMKKSSMCQKLGRLQNWSVRFEKPQRLCVMGRSVPLLCSATLNLSRFNWGGGSERDVGSGYPVSSYLARRGRSLKQRGGIKYRQVSFISLCVCI